MDPRTGNVVNVDPNAVAPVDSPIPGGASGPRPIRSAEAGEFPDQEDIEVEVAVEVEVVEAPRPEPAEAVEEEVSERHTVGKYTLQLQSVRDPDEAQMFLELMKDRGYHPFVQRVELGDKGRWHRVRVGRFMKMKAAQKFKRKFESDQGFSTRIMSL